jgi:hypothetical protein
MTVVRGTVNNGWSSDVDFPFYKGPAGAQRGPAGIRFGYAGAMVRDMVGATGTVTLPDPENPDEMVTINATVTEAAKSDTTRGFVTFTAILTPAFLTD